METYRTCIISLILLLYMAGVPALANNTFKMKGETLDYTYTNTGFGGRLIVTSDLNWKEKWNTPSGRIPSFTEKERIGLGESIAVLILYTNPAVDQTNRINIFCDIRLKQPDGQISLEQKDVVCANEQIKGDTRNIRLSYAVLDFSVDVSDPYGVWTIEVKLKDEISGSEVYLRRFLEVVNRATVASLATVSMSSLPAQTQTSL